MNQDERFKLYPLNFVEILCGHVNERVEDVQEQLVGSSHDFLVRASLLQGQLGISGPKDLNAYNSNLLHVDYKQDNFSLDMLNVATSFTVQTVHTKNAQ